MKLLGSAKKTAVIVVCILIAYSLVSYIMLLFIGSLAKSVIEPMSYANINFVNCEMSKLHASYLTGTIQRPCRFMNAYMNNSGGKCSIDELKNLANDMPMEKSRQNTGFLMDVVFVAYQNSILKDICKIKEFEDYHNNREGSLYTPSLFRAILSEHKMIHPQKDSFSANLAISLDSQFLSAVDAIMTAWTVGLNNNFKDECLLDSEICDEKYYEFYEILTEKVIETVRDESVKRNVTFRKAQPVHEGDDLYLLVNSFLYASEENNNWSNPVSNMTYTVISEIGNMYAIRFEDGEKTGQIPDFRELSLPEMYGISLNVIQNVGFVMGIAAIKTAYFAGLTQEIKEKCDEIERKYTICCMNDINCTKEVFQSNKYQSCIITCEENIDRDYEKYRECGDNCNSINCDDVCEELRAKWISMDNEYPSCVRECYYG